MSEVISTEVVASEQVEYRDIAGWPGYRVGNDGSVWSCRVAGNSWLTSEWKRMALAADKRGYLRVSFSRNGRNSIFLVHALVLTAFVGPRSDGMHCRHFPDRNTGNNRLCNLSWGTREENMADRIVHGTVPLGEDHHNHKLNDERVLQIRRRLAAKEKGSDLAIEYGVSQVTIHDIKHGKTWNHLWEGK